MKLIIPMAGMGTRLRPHTLTTPKPLLPIAGKSIVQRLIEEVSSVLNSKIEEIAFIIGDFSEEVKQNLSEIATNYGAIPKFYTQDVPLGTAHAIYCAKNSLENEVIIAFADTLFKADFKLDTEIDSIIWTKEVENPNQYGVVKLNNKGYITDFVEKPKKFVSNQAIVGIYYFKEAEKLRDEIKFLIDNKIVVGTEYQLTTALENLKNKNFKFKTQTLTEWLDCGNKDITVNTNQRILHHLPKNELIDRSAKITNSVINEPCFIGENVVIENSIVGPYVSVEKNNIVKNSNIKNSIIQENSHIENQIFSNSMIGNFVQMISKVPDLSIGDYTKII